MRLISVLLLCTATACFGGDKLVGGPYVVTPAARSATIGWVVETDSVKVGPAPGEVSRRIPVLRSEKISLTGLKAGETVHYEIPGDAPVAERSGHFKVAPTGPSSFHFVVFGDTRTRDDLHRRIVQAIAKTEPDFVLHTGDLVTDGYDTAQWPNFFDIERELLRKTVYFPVLGNHERNNARFHEFFDVKSPYYSFNWGSAHFALLDTDIANWSVSQAERERFWSDQVRWLEQDLQKAEKADFRFLVMHHPPMTAYQKEDHMSKETPGLVPLCEKYKVTALFAGHDHNYQHHIQNGVHYIITGGGGAPLAPVDNPIPGITQIVEKTEHYVTVSVEGNRATINAIALDGHLIETIELPPLK
jgi:predicted phosphodiesterase